MENITVYSTLPAYSYLLGSYKKPRHLYQKYKKIENEKLLVTEKNSNRWKCKCGNWNWDFGYENLYCSNCKAESICVTLTLYPDGRIGAHTENNSIQYIGSYKL